MKLILCLTFTICCFALSQADSDDVGYSLALGPLEFFLKQEIEEVSYCYKENKDDYENSVIDFLNELISVNTNIKGSNIDQKSKDLTTLGWNELNNIGNSLTNFFDGLKRNIFNGKLVEGGKTIWRERCKVEVYYRQHEKHGNELKNHNIKDYDTFFPSMTGILGKILQKSQGLSNNILKCLASKGVTYTK